ncbi:MAG: alpha/beta hydrolase [Kineosporiaceae bacterium]
MGEVRGPCTRPSTRPSTRPCARRRPIAAAALSLALAAGLAGAVGGSVGAGAAAASTRAAAAPVLGHGALPAAVSVPRRLPSPVPARTVTPSPTRSLPADPRVPSRYLTQTLRWQQCFTPTQLREQGYPLSFLRLQCATFSAPLDWSAPDGGTDVRIAVSRLAATSPRKGRDGVPAAPALFTNPGGPGAAGIMLPLSFLDAGRTALLAAQDVYGIDVRGTGASTALTCGSWAQLSLDPRDRRPEAIALTLTLSEAHAGACHLRGGALLTHVTTDQAVQDLDLLRRLVRRERVNWLGYSAGTWLGVQYATAFPHHVGRFVLDSSTDFTADWQAVQGYQPMAFQRRFEQDFAVWAGAHDAYFGMGASGPAVVSFYEDLRADLAAASDADPSSVPLDGASLDALIAAELYTKTSFQELGEVLVLLRAIVDGEAAVAGVPVPGVAASSRAAAARAALARVRPLLTAALAAARTGGWRLNRTPLGADSFDATFYATTCGDTPWVGDAASLESASAAAGAAYPLLGWSILDQPCVFWSRPTPSAVVPVPTGTGLPSMLMVQSVHDPATALEGAQHAASTFSAARLLTVTGEGDHGVYASGNACVDTAVERYLLLGTLPAPSTTCAGTGVPLLAASLTSLDAAAAAVPRAIAARAASGTPAHVGGAPVRVGLATVAPRPADALGRARAHAADWARIHPSGAGMLRSRG